MFQNGLENITLVGVPGQTQVIEDNNFEVSSPSADYDDIPQAKKRRFLFYCQSNVVVLSVVILKKNCSFIPNLVFSLQVKQ